MVTTELVFLSRVFSTFLCLQLVGQNVNNPKFWVLGVESRTMRTVVRATLLVPCSILSVLCDSYRVMHWQDFLCWDIFSCCVPMPCASALSEVFMVSFQQRLLLELYWSLLSVGFMWRFFFG